MIVLDASAAVELLLGTPRAAPLAARLADESPSLHAPQLQLRANLTTYDAAYVALAEALEAPLVTFDARLAGATGHRAVVELMR